MQGIPNIGIPAALLSSYALQWSHVAKPHSALRGLAT